MDNSNINARNLGSKGLHLNSTGTSRLRENLLSSIKPFWKAKGCQSIINDKKIEREHPWVFDSTLSTSINDSEDQAENRNLKAITNWQTETVPSLGD